MDFEKMILELLQTPIFRKKLNERFEKYCLEKHLPAALVANHKVTWDEAADSGAAVLAEIVGETMEKHPFLAKQAMRMMEV